MSSPYLNQTVGGCGRGNSRPCTPIKRTGDHITQYLLSLTSAGTGSTGTTTSTGAVATTVTTAKYPLSFASILLSSLAPNVTSETVTINISQLLINHMIVDATLYIQGASNGVVPTSPLPYVLSNGLLSSNNLVFTVTTPVNVTTATLYVAYY